MKTKLVTYISVIVLAWSIFLAGSVASEINCAGISHWSKTYPPVNQQHVFCGEWKQRKNRPAGFHSRPAGENPATIGTLKITQRSNVRGIYGVRWSYADHPGREKFSSMFPDTCSREQVLNSIVYAVNHPRACPAGAPHWAKCGPNKPTRGGQEYCETSDNSIFTIAFAKLRSGNKINTAFPLMD